MDAIQQHMIDSYRAAQHGELPPPLPGRHDWAVARDVRDRRRFAAVMAGLPARRRWRTALRGLVTHDHGHRSTPPDGPTPPDSSTPPGGSGRSGV
ncbi:MULTISPECIES: hypothetical protein [Streptomyces]|jgi:hypothetical protein|uniref:hypothetical protein n=1 Tax=unclassified Streptomyces TaxID=2593676 RepID=UPI000883F7C0|nr:MULTISPECIES: hypothetical protein [unclassified Streptomyces]MDX2732748.1 hypothetical protein [Streptomyces sp. PA03-2a]MDX3770176.1 hypothetical protein [Streptomyces sp. AK08-01B]MDX3819447.1 hypothetical protein [Streptomyces sp. AK08-01A]SCZ12643.1 hypothetical protein SAMN02745898_11138 [Streptomyces sp. 136MFCol5.1]SFT31191.1 hypothetical protein SAMN04487982_11838 [Streptomyces sp. ok210]